MAQLGPGNPLVGLENIYNTLQKICENAGLKTVHPYFQDPGSAQASAFAEAMAGEPASAPPGPRAVAAEGKAQADLVRAQNEPAIARQQALLEMLGKLLAAK